MESLLADLAGTIARGIEVKVILRKPKSEKSIDLQSDVSSVLLNAGCKVTVCDEPLTGIAVFDGRELGDAYYAIGTDFFEAEVNLPDRGNRITHTFYSYDPLAKAAATNGLEMCWLDFARVPVDSPLRACIDEPFMMGSVGDAFSPLMYVLPQTYRIKREPVSMYDSIILVAHAHPTQIKDKQR